MNKTVRSLSSLFLAVVLLVGMAVPASAAESTVTYQGKTLGIEFEPGSYYTETDLFENFKEVMPGDVRSETVTVINDYAGCDYIQVWMGALLHDGSGNPISPNVLAELQADERKGQLSELEYMYDFLSQLTLSVWNGDELIYTGSPDSLDQGFEDGYVYLGTLRRGRSLELDVQLEVDIEMGNEYADRIGEVDWVFVVQERDTPTPGPDPKPDPDPDPKPDKPKPADPDRPDMGDDTVILPYVLLLAAGLAGMLAVVFGKRKKKDQQR